MYVHHTFAASNIISCFSENQSFIMHKFLNQLPCSSVTTAWQFDNALFHFLNKPFRHNYCNLAWIYYVQWWKKTWTVIIAKGSGGYRIVKAIIIWYNDNFWCVALATMLVTMTNIVKSLGLYCMMQINMNGTVIIAKGIKDKITVKKYH